ncbi:N-acetylmuramoyl-L-alanine amidase [Terrisporobacter petrolearius]|uniref:N-acetylmuramoyl-L-alanine amidase n=1 Tax=Terrisporobacter petrolearius TaxID=1460447 RepID=UPI003B00EC54
MSYINNGVIKNGSKIGTATVDSSGLLKKGWMIPYVSFTPSSVTIHETDMPNVSSEQIYKSLKNGNSDTSRKQASFQICVSATKIMQCVNLFRTCWHTGNRTGSSTSIGIEVVQHNYWSGKNCPSKLRAKWKGYTWDWFTNLVYSENKYTKLKNGDYNKKAIVITPTLNVRKSRPDKNGKLGKYDFKLKEGDIIEVGYVLNGWASIWIEGDMGYINTSSKYIKLL